MTTGHDQDPARQYLAAIGAALTADGIPCRLTRDGGIPTLTIEEPGAAHDPATVIILHGPPFSAGRSGAGWMRGAGW